MAHSLVVGGTKGLGRVVTRLLAQRGDAVSVFGRSEAAAVDREAGEVDAYPLDITDTTQVAAAIDKLVAKRGPLNYCVFLQRYRGTDDAWAGEIATTLTATKNIIDMLVPHMSKSGDKSFVMVSSVFARYVGKGQDASYHVAKAGLDQLMRFYAVNLGEDGVRCNGVTPFTFLKEESQEFYLNNEKIMDVYKEMIPLRRMATAEDSANAIVFLCSEKAAFLTGQNITVDGGLSLVWQESLVRRMMNI